MMILSVAVMQKLCCAPRGFKVYLIKTPIMLSFRRMLWNNSYLYDFTKPQISLTYELTCARRISSNFSKRKRSTLFYMSGLTVLVLGLSYAAVPLYRMYCQATSYGGQVKVGHDDSKLEGMKKVGHRVIQVKFNADTASSMTWNFKPQQPDIYVSPGETALAFYTATNPTDRPVTGIATYNVLPFEAGQYLNKIQCFCFEEQRLNPHEQVDMPVFFYLDPEYAEDPKLEEVNSIMLSYTFFEAKEGLVLPTPSYARR